MKILVACGNGMGSSVLLKLKVEGVCRDYGLSATVENTSLGDAMSIARGYDILLCPLSFADSFKDITGVKVAALQNMLDPEEIASALRKCGAIS